LKLSKNLITWLWEQLLASCNRNKLNIFHTLSSINLYRVGAETTTGCILAASALGKRGVPANDVGTGATENLLHDLSYQACVDQHLQDQV
jgi:hypothetical protein